MARCRSGFVVRYSFLPCLHVRGPAHRYCPTSPMLCSIAPAPALGQFTKCALTSDLRCSVPMARSAVLSADALRLRAAAPCGRDRNLIAPLHAPPCRAGVAEGPAHPCIILPLRPQGNALRAHCPTTYAASYPLARPCHDDCVAIIAPGATPCVHRDAVEGAEADQTFLSFFVIALR